MGLREILHRDALVAGERREQDLDLVLLDQLAYGANRGVGCRIGGRDDEFELLVTHLFAEGIKCSLEAADAILAEHGVGALKRCGDADLDLFLSERGPWKHQAAQHDQSYTALQHCTPPFLDKI